MRLFVRRDKHEGMFLYKSKHHALEQTSECIYIPYDVRLDRALRFLPEDTIIECKVRFEQRESWTIEDLRKEQNATME